MKKTILPALAALFISSIIAADAYSGYDGCYGGRGASVDERCPIMGGKVDKDTATTVEYEGKTIGLCCAGCKAELDKDPQGYMKRLQDTQKGQEKL